MVAKPLTGDFYERFNIEYQAFNASGAKIIQVPYMPEDEAANQELVDRVMNQEDEIHAYKFLSKLDKRRYGHLLDELNNGFIECPKKLATQKSGQEPRLSGKVKARGWRPRSLERKDWNPPSSY
jgi:hypothetical protein